MENERLLSLEEAAQLLGGVSVKTVRRMIASGDLPRSIKVRSVPTLLLSDVLSYFEKQKNQRATRRS